MRNTRNTHSQQLLLTEHKNRHNYQTFHTSCNIGPFPFTLKSNPYVGLLQALRAQDIEAPRISRQSHMKVSTLSALRTGRLYSTTDTPSTYFCYKLSRPRVTVRQQGLSQWKIPMTLSGMEPATFQLIARCPVTLPSTISQHSTSPPTYLFRRTCGHYLGTFTAVKCSSTVRNVVSPLPTNPNSFSSSGKKINK